MIRIADDGKRGHLASGAARRRDADQTDMLSVIHALRHFADGFGKVHGRSSADAHDRITAGFQVGSDAGNDFRDGRIRNDLGKYFICDAALRQRLYDVADRVALNDEGVGYNKDLLTVELTQAAE